MSKIKKGDMVEVITGKNSGERGQVLEILKETNQVVVEGLNIQKRHIKAGSRQSMPQGGIVDRPGKIHVSNVRLFAGKLDRGVRVGFKIAKDGTKLRVARGREIGGTELD